jgi:plastocyanin
MKICVIALLSGIGAAALITGIPALAADQSVAAAAGNTWNPAQVSIAPGEKVTWSNATGIPHNVCVAKPGDTPGPAAASCTEFRNSDPSTAGWSDAHAFPTAGTYAFVCQAHLSTMQGTVVVGDGSGTTTTTTTTTGPGTTTTETTPTQTQTGTTPTQTAPANDTTVPRFTTAIKRRAGRRALTLRFGSSEAGRLEATVFRRPPRGRSFARIGKVSLKVSPGANTLTVPRKAAGTLRSGAYRIRLVLVDAAGNRSAARVLIFKLA